MAEQLDWSKLPAELNWLAEPASRYGGFQFDERIYEYLRQIGPQERAELKALSDRYGEAWESINSWLNTYAMTSHPEARLVYFTGVLLGTGADAGLL